MQRMGLAVSSAQRTFNPMERVGMCVAILKQMMIRTTSRTRSHKHQPQLRPPQPGRQSDTYAGQDKRVWFTLINPPAP